LNFEPDTMKSKIIIILGPTGVGKSETALELAQEFGAEIINADSLQVYRYMDVGTGKPSKAERERVPHHVIDVVDPDEEFNAAVFRKLSLESVENIQRRGRAAIVCGGTGLYIKALTGGLFTGPPRDTEIRKKFEAEIDGCGLNTLYKRLQDIDASATSWIHPNDRQRIIRALEVYDLTGQPISAWQAEHAFTARGFDTLMLGLNRDRAELYELINRRCNRMIDEGLPEEVRGLVEKGYGLTLRPMQSVGYRHMGLLLSGQMSAVEALELMKRDTRRLAKRQLTWFRQNREVQWYHPDTGRDGLKAAVADFLS
jgi:tRNA dimethylallyltransferase